MQLKIEAGVQDSGLFLCLLPSWHATQRKGDPGMLWFKKGLGVERRPWHTVCNS